MSGYFTRISMKVVVMHFTIIVVVAAVSFIRTVDAAKEASLQEQIVFHSDSDVFVANWQDGLSDLKPSSFIYCPAGSCLKNIIDVVASGQLLAILAINPTTEKFAIFSAELSSGSLEKIVEADDKYGMFQSIALSPDKQAVAFLSGSASKSKPALIDILLFDRQKRQFVTLVKERASDSTHLSWHPSGEYLTFDSVDGWMESVYLKDRHVEKIIAGVAPAWSPDGGTLTFQKDKSIFLYDVARRNTAKLYGRFFWQTNWVGHMNWSSDGKYLSANVGSGLLGYDYECLLIEPTSGNVRSIYSSAYPCGPLMRGAP